MSFSIPRSRKISTVRWLVMWARGVFAVHEYLVITTCSTPRVASDSAAAPPAGPLPTTRTSVCRISVIELLPGEANVEHELPPAASPTHLCAEAGVVAFILVLAPCRRALWRQLNPPTSLAIPNQTARRAVTVVMAGRRQRPVAGGGDGVYATVMRVRSHVVWARCVRKNSVSFARAGVTYSSLSYSATWVAASIQH